MRLTPLAAMVRKDLQLFFTDRRSLIMSFAVPIAIGSFFGSVFSGARGNAEPARITIAVIDRDNTTISNGIVSGLQGDKNLRVTLSSKDEARASVQRGRTSVAVIVPKGFGDAAGQAFFGNGEKPNLDLVYDPSRNFEAAMVRGLLTQYVMQSVSKEMFNGEQGRQNVDRTLSRIEGSTTMSEDDKRLLIQMLRSVQNFYDRTDRNAASRPAPGLSMPYTVREEAMTAGSNIAYNGYAHAFAGMGIQFLLFAMANLGIEVLLERQRGLWNRVRSAPLSRATLLTAKATSGTLIALSTLWVSFAFAILVFKVRISGSLIGFVAVSLACSIMAATFGLLIAAIGKTPGTARGVTTLAVLMMVMLGGAWVPTFIFPAWLQQATLVVPARWAVDGLDAMTWRGIGLSGAIAPTLVLLGFAATFGTVAASQFRWEEA